MTEKHMNTWKLEERIQLVKHYYHQEIISRVGASKHNNRMQSDFKNSPCVWQPFFFPCRLSETDCKGSQCLAGVDFKHWCEVKKWECEHSPEFVPIECPHIITPQIHSLLVNELPEKNKQAFSSQIDGGQQLADERSARTHAGWCNFIQTVFESLKRK